MLGTFMTITSQNHPKILHIISLNFGLEVSLRAKTTWRRIQQKVVQPNNFLQTEEFHKKTKCFWNHMNRVHTTVTFFLIGDWCCCFTDMISKTVNSVTQQLSRRELKVS